MWDSKLLNLLRLLEPKEAIRFHDFLRSPFFNKDPLVIKLMDLIQNSYLKSPPTYLDDTQICKSLFGTGASKNGKRLVKAKHKLLQLFNRFLVEIGVEREEGIQTTFLLRELNLRGETKYFPGFSKKAEKKIDISRTTGIENKFRIELERTLHILKNENRSAHPQMKILFNSYSNLMFLWALRLAVMSLNQARVVGKAIDNTPIKMIVELFSSSHPQDHQPTLIQLYHLLYLGLAHPEDPENYQNLRSLFSNCQTELHREVRTELYIGMSNICISRLNQGQLSYRRELFGIYKEMLQNNLLRDQEGKLSPFHFKNIVSLGSKLREFDWVESFIEKFENQLASYPDPVAKDYNTAVLLFYRGNYSDGIPLFQKVIRSQEDAFYKLDARAYLLMSAYESNEVDIMESLVGSSRKFIDRMETISPERLENYRRFVSHFRKLRNLSPDTQKGKAKLREQVKNSGQGPGMEWLLEKLG